jgi:hypothetical protein
MVFSKTSSNGDGLGPEQQMSAWFEKEEVSGLAENRNYFFA